MQANAFLVYEDTKEGFIVDPGDEAERIMKEVSRHCIEKITHILLTHGHFDHIGAAAHIKKQSGAKVCIHRRDVSMLKSQRDNLSVMAGAPVPTTDADVVFEGGETLNAAGIEVKVVHTPGHSGGSVCYIAGDSLFAGDTLFYMSVGRTDFPGSAPKEYHHTLTHVLRGLGRDYTVYTGHGPSTTLEYEFSTNPFLTS